MPVQNEASASIPSRPLTNDSHDDKLESDSNASSVSEQSSVSFQVFVIGCQKYGSNGLPERQLTPIKDL
ncbi:unnamed protein product [Anisakis simplex]|uniref:Uncharacterized protein n=1 Tax=Anisakis simplex TaxID=6269 RepID=A0A0M3K9U8_ANISI|nr:unnamed protein product [Anisakis simplex]